MSDEYLLNIDKIYYFLIKKCSFICICAFFVVPLRTLKNFETMKHLLLGDEAIAQGAIDAGLSGVYAYPGTPSTEITEYI